MWASIRPITHPPHRPESPRDGPFGLAQDRPFDFAHDKLAEAEEIEQFKVHGERAFEARPSPPPRNWMSEQTGKARTHVTVSI